MQRITLTALLLTLMLIVSIDANAKEWYQGGTLHNATYAQWNNATYQNKLATAGDWLTATKWKDYLKTPNDFARLKVKAGMLVKGLDTVTTLDGAGSLKVTEAAAFILAVSNDLDP